MSHHRFHITRLNAAGTLLLGVALALATPALRTAEHTVSTVKTDEHETTTAAVQTKTSYALVREHVPDTQQALVEMSSYAALRFNEFELLPETLTLDETWSPEWHLHSIDVIHNGEIVRLYHATHKHHPDVRFASMWLPDGATDWEPAH